MLCYATLRYLRYAMQCCIIDKKNNVCYWPLLLSQFANGMSLESFCTTGVILCRM